MFFPAMEIHAYVIASERDLQRSVINICTADGRRSLGSYITHVQ